ncbi:MAG: hypothetical protein ACLQPD_09320 [Desulfomonilaceae bacterium]
MLDQRALRPELNCLPGVKVDVVAEKARENGFANESKEKWLPSNDRERLIDILEAIYCIKIAFKREGNSRLDEIIQKFKPRYPTLGESRGWNPPLITLHSIAFLPATKKLAIRR